MIGSQRFPRKRPAIALVAAISTLSAALSGCGSTKAPAGEVGEPAPSYSATSLQGTKVSLDLLRGHPVLLNVWATWCAPCREEIPYLTRLYDAYRGQGLEIVGVSIDARGQEDRIADFAKEIRMPYSIWLDPDQRVAASFMAFGVPASYLLDAKGIVRWKHVGTLRPSNGVFKAALGEVLKDHATP